MEMIETGLARDNDNRTDNSSKRIDVYDTIVCPHCNKEVRLIRYGGGWVGSCCNRVVYNSQTLPDY
jgi:hypothetical protein